MMFWEFRLSITVSNKIRQEQVASLLELPAASKGSIASKKKKKIHANDVYKGAVRTLIMHVRKQIYNYIVVDK